jgi:glycosyltransferase involved in cell wall biosynthesis
MLNALITTLANASRCLRPANATDTNRSDFGFTVHAVLPPPVTGMTLCTECVADAVERRIAVRRYNWSNGSSTITKWFRFVKMLRALGTPVRLLLRSRPQHGVFYMPCNAGVATIYNFLAILTARLRGYRCVLHHHFYRYVDRFQWRIKILTGLLGKHDLQILLCPEMEIRFRSLYGEMLPLAIIPSSIQLLQAGTPSYRPPGERRTPFYLGHISNLQMTKGLDTVIEVLRALRERGRDVRLILAGPIQSPIEQQLIDKAKEEFGHTLDYRGAVYGADKHRFFEDLHVKLFPTRYPDAQPLVITEAFSYSRPVIAFAQGCIPSMVSEQTGWSIPRDASFVPAAVAQIESWIDNPITYDDACRAAYARYVSMLKEASEALDNFVGWVCNEPAPDFVRRGTNSVNCAM